MRICQVTTRYPPNTGGVETHVQEISKRLVARGHDVTVLTADLTPGLDARERQNGVTIHRHNGFAPGGAFHVAPGISRTLWRLDADVVHAHNYHSLPLLFAALTVGDTRFVVTPHYHGGSADSTRDRLLAAYRPLGGWALRRADSVIAVSNWECGRLRTDFDIEVTTIPNGVTVERFRDADPERRDRPYLLCVGRLEEYKGVQHLIRALPDLPEYDLLIAGTGPYREALERIARRESVAERVEFLGYVKDGRLSGLYAGAAIYVTLSEFEAYGMTVAEALAARTPCVVRETGALVDWTRRGGCVGVRRIDPASIAAAVAEACSETPTEPLPSWDAVVDSVLEMYA